MEGTSVVVFKKGAISAHKIPQVQNLWKNVFFSEKMEVFDFFGPNILRERFKWRSKDNWAHY